MLGIAQHETCGARLSAHAALLRHHHSLECLIRTVLPFTCSRWLLCAHAHCCCCRPPDAIRTGGAQVTPLRPGPRALTRRPEAEWRWMLLRLHVKARQAYK